MIQVSTTNINAPSNTNFSTHITPSSSASGSIYELETKYHYFDYNEMKLLFQKHSKNFIKIALHNARSLINNIDNYRAFVANSRLDVLSITETWLKPSNTNKSVELEGYAIVRSDRKIKKKTRGGGVAFYVKKTLKHFVISKSEPESEIEYIFIKIKQINLVCGIVYKPPDVNISKLETIFKILSEICSTEPNVLVMGDFNINLMNKESSMTVKMIDNVTALSFKIVPTQPTCHKPNSSSTLDLIFGNCTNNLNNVYQSSIGGISDHDMICIDYKYKQFKMNSDVYWTRDFYKIDYNSFLSDLTCEAFNNVYNFTSADEKLRCFNDIFFKILDNHAPLKKKIVKDPTKPWFNAHIEKLLKNRSDAYECWKRHKSNPHKWKNFTLLRNQANREIKQRKQEYFTSQLSADLPAKQLWTNIRRLGLKHTNTQVGGGDVVADSLNVFFVSHCNPVTFNQIESDIDSQQTFSFRGVTNDEVLSEFVAASCDAVGNDSIPLNILKKSLSITLPYITDIFNCCISTTVFPADWKVAKVIPIGKIENPINEKDYRPISILCALSKIFEAILSKQLNEYLTVNELLCPFQSGYRKTCSTVTALIKIENDIKEALDKKNMTIMALLDFSKAFDSIDHRLLCNKLKHNFMLDHLSVNLILSYLSNRKQYVEFNNKQSQLIPVLNGVPQGSILGPLLFSLYINDLPLSLSHCKFHLYADDCQLYISGEPRNISEIVNKINSDIENILIWCNHNGLILNAKKTQTIIFRSARMKLINMPLIKVGDDLIDYSNIVKNLGLMMDSNLNWYAQVNAVCNKVYNALHSLVLLRHCTPQHIRIQLARSLLVPLFDYGDTLFGLVSTKNLNKLNLVFNAVTRYAFNLKKYEHISNYRNQLLGCNLTNHLKLRMYIQVHKIINNPPSYLKNFFEYVRSSRVSALIVPRCNSNDLKVSFRHRAVKLWNDLPRNCRSERDLICFKRKIGCVLN